MVLIQDSKNDFHPAAHKGRARSFDLKVLRLSPCPFPVTEWVAFMQEVLATWGSENHRLRVFCFVLFFTRATAIIITFWERESHLHFKKTHSLTFIFLSWWVMAVSTSQADQQQIQRGSKVLSWSQEDSASAKVGVSQDGLLPLPLFFRSSLLCLTSPLTQGLKQQAICMLARLVLRGLPWSYVPIPTVTWKDL